METEYLKKINYLLSFYSKAELAKLLNLKSAQVVRNWVNRGSVPEWRFDAVDILFNKESKKPILMHRKR